MAEANARDYPDSDSSSHDRSSHSHGSADDSGFGASSSRKSSVGEGLDHLHRPALADRLFGYLSVAPRLRYENSWKLQGLILVYLYVFLAVYSVHPTWKYKWGWDNPVGRWALRLQGHGWATVSGSTAVLQGLTLSALALTVFQACVALYLFLVGKGLVRSFRGAKTIARLVEVFYFKLFGLPALGVLLAPMSCDTKGILTGVKGNNVFLPDVSCSDPSLRLLGYAGLIVGLVIHLPLYLMLTLKEVEVNPLTSVAFASGSFLAVARIEFLRVLALVLFHLARGAQPTVFGIIISAIWLWIVYVNLVRLPHLGHAHSVFRVACECALCWAFLASAFTVAGVDGRAPLAVGAAVAAVAGAFWARRRIRNEVAVIAKFYELKPVLGMTTKRVHKFWDGEEPELLVRMLRQGLTPVPCTEEEISGCSAAVSHALTHFTENPEAVVAMACLQAFFEGDIQGAHSSIQKARSGHKIPTTLKLGILFMDMEVRYKQKTESGEGLDWASYVELQMNLQSLLEVHRRAADAPREAFKVLAGVDIGLDDISRSLHRMERCGDRAEAAYRDLLKTHPDYPRLLQMYSRFQEEVQANLSVSQHYQKLAETYEDKMRAKAEQLAGQQEDTMVQGLHQKKLSNIDEARDAVVVISTDGNIIFANRNLCEMFGYATKELVGTNVANLMPAPYSNNHDRYMKAYISTGQARVLNTVRVVIALHSTKEVFPVTICITKIAQSGHDAFMGVMRKVEDDLNEAKAYVTPEGSFLHMTRPFPALLGWAQPELASQSLDAVFANKETATTVLLKAIEGGEVGYVQMTARAKTRTGEVMPVQVTTHLYGSEHARIVGVTLARTSDDRATSLLSVVGQLLSPNAPMEKLTGHRVNALRSMTLPELLQEPLRSLLKDRLHRSADGTGLAWLNGRAVKLAHQMGRPVHCRLTIAPIEAAKETGPVAAGAVARLFVEDLPADQFRLENTMELLVGADGRLSQCNTLPSSFGYGPGDLTAARLDQVLAMQVEPDEFLAALAGEEHAAGPHEWSDGCFLATVSGPTGGQFAALVRWRPVDYPENALHMSVTRMDRLGVLIETDAQMKVLHVDAPQPLLAEGDIAAMIGRDVAEFLPAVPLTRAMLGFAEAGAEGAGPMGALLPDGIVVVMGRPLRCSVHVLPKHGALGRATLHVDLSGLPVPLPLGSKAWAAPGDVAMPEPSNPSEGGGTSRNASQRSLRAGPSLLERRISLRAARLSQAAAAGDAGLRTITEGDLLRDLEAAGDNRAADGAAERDAEAEAEADEDAWKRGVSYKRTRDWVMAEGKPAVLDDLREAVGEPEPRLSSSAIRRLQGFLRGRSQRTMRDMAAAVRRQEGDDGEGSSNSSAASGQSSGARLTRQGTMRSLLTRQDTLRGGLGRLRSMIPGMALQEAVEEEGEANDGAADAGDDGAGAEGERVASREEQAEVAPQAAKETWGGPADGLEATRGLSIGEAATERGTEAAAPRDATMQAQDRLDSKGRSSGGEEAGPKGTDTPETNDNTEIAPATPDRDARPAGPSGRAEGGDKAFREGGEGRLAKQGVKVKVGGEGGVGAGKGEEGDEDGASEAGSDRLRAFGKRDEKDVLAVSGEEPVAARARRQRKIQTLLTCQGLLRPLVLLRYSLWVVAAITLIVQTVLFGVMLGFVSSLSKVFSGVDNCDVLIQRTLDIVSHSWTAYSLTVDVAVPGADLASDLATLSQESDEFLTRHNELMALMSSYSGSWSQRAKAVLEAPLTISQLTASDWAAGQMRNTTDVLRNVGTTFAAQSMAVARVTPAALANTELARLSSFRYVVDNGVDPIATQYLRSLDFLMQRVAFELQRIAILAVAFLIIQVGALVPVGSIFLRVQLRGVLATRLRRAAIVVAAPKAVLGELARRKATVLDEEESKGPAGPGGEAAAAAQRGGRGFDIRTLLSHKMDATRMEAARELLVSRRMRQKSHTRTEFRLLAPFLLWGAVVLLFYLLTFFLANKLRTRMVEPRRAVAIMGSLSRRALIDALEWVVETHQVEQNDPYVSSGIDLLSGDMAKAANDLEQVTWSFVWNNDNLLGKYKMIQKPPTAFSSKQLEDTFFGNPCLKMSGQCAGPSDPDYASLERGLFALGARYVQEIRLFAQDPAAEINGANSRYQFIAQHGADEMVVGIDKVRQEITKDSSVVSIILDLQCVLLVITYALCASFIFVVLRPIVALLNMEAKNLAVLIAFLPKELGAEEAVLKMCTELEMGKSEEASRALLELVGMDTTEAEGGKEGAEGAGAPVPAKGTPAKAASGKGIVGKALRGKN